jgi:hypothetical protein
MTVNSWGPAQPHSKAKVQIRHRSDTLRENTEGKKRANQEVLHLIIVSFQRGESFPLLLFLLAKIFVADPGS